MNMISFGFITDAQKSDPQSLSFIKKCLGPNKISREKLQQLSSNLKKKEVVIDQAKRYLDRIRTLEEQLENSRRSSSQTEVKNVDHQVNDPSETFQRLQEDYKILETELEGKDKLVFKLNQDYTNLLESLNKANSQTEFWTGKCELYGQVIHKQLSNEIGQAGKEIAGSNLRRQLRGMEQDKFDLQGKLNSLDIELRQTKKSLEETETRLKSLEDQLQTSIKETERIKEKLNLPLEASLITVREKIHELKEKDSSKTEELDKAYQNLQVKENDNHELEQRISTLTREKQKLQIDISQLESDQQILNSERDPILAELERKEKDETRVKEIMVNQALEETCGNVASGDSVRPQHKSNLITIKANLPPLGIRASQPLSSMPPSVSLHTYPNILYCLLCRTNFDISGDNICKAHYRPVYRGKWGCCGQFHHNELGCLSLPHLFVQKDASGFFLTNNGSNFIRIK